MKSDAQPAWVRDALETPLMFAQVREDPRQDQALLARLRQEGRRGLRVLQVGSGGCTAAALAGEAELAELVLVDPNPAQLALCRLKLRLLQQVAPAERLALLGHTPLPAAERRRGLEEHLAALGLTLQDLGPPGSVLELGPDQSGRYERTFAALRAALHEQAPALAELLALRDPARQAAQVAPGTPLGEALDRAFSDAFALDPLVALFGEGATSNRVQPFDRHFLERTRHVLATLPAADNPYLWQVLAGRYPELPAPWLSAPAPAAPPRLELVQAFMNQALAARDDAFDLIHLSNILDWLSHEEAAETLALASARLRPGGLVVIRQLNSTVDVEAAGPELRWERELATPLQAADRSYFYRALHVGRRP